MMGSGRRRIDWSEIVDLVEREVVPYFSSQGVKPTLRTIFYYLVSKGLIPNTRSSYKSLSRVLVSARKRGVLSWDFLADRTRSVYRDFDDSYKSEKDLDYVKLRCEQKLNEISIETLLSDFFDYLAVSKTVGYWARQPVIPEIWIEKEALAETVHRWVRKYEVNVRVNRGYPSWTFIYENVRELRTLLIDHEQVVVYYLGDYDPSGVDIERFLREALSYFNIEEEKVKLVRLAVTPEQVEKYNLPPRPEDAETLAKLARDPRSKKYKLQYIVELDALVAYVPQEFKRIITEAIERVHDKEIYDEVRRQAEEIHRRSLEIINEYKRRALEKILGEVKDLLSRS